MKGSQEDPQEVGTWVLSWAGGGTSPITTKTAPVYLLPDGTEEPKVIEEAYGLTFDWADGRRYVWPWTNLLIAEFVPAERERA